MCKNKTPQTFILTKYFKIANAVLMFTYLCDIETSYEII